MIMNNLLTEYRDHPNALRNYLSQERLHYPGSLASAIDDRPDKEEVVEAYVHQWQRRVIIH